MSKNTIETQGKIFMMDAGKKIIVPENNLLKAADQLKQEKELKEVAEKALQLAREKQEEINERIERLEMLPIGNKIIISPYPTNPYRQIVQSDILVDVDSVFMNPDTGMLEESEQFVKCAKVVEVGIDCNSIRPGDDVYYDKRTVYPLPFMKMGYLVTHESGVLVHINEGLKNRYNGE
jgi:hypothetical protein